MREKKEKNNTLGRDKTYMEVQRQNIASIMNPEVQTVPASFAGEGGQWWFQLSSTGHKRANQRKRTIRQAALYAKLESALYFESYEKNKALGWGQQDIYALERAEGKTGQNGGMEICQEVTIIIHARSGKYLNPVGGSSNKEQGSIVT